MPSAHSSSPGAVTVRAPAKINLGLRVGPRQADGFHPLASVFHAIDRYDYITVSSAASLSISATTELPLGPSNLVWQAAVAVAQEAGLAPAVHIRIDKQIPVAGGMAGGSADAAATLLACSRLWGLDLPIARLRELAAGLGSDVPFALHGGTALGLGRGDQLTGVACPGRFAWVVMPADQGLSTPRVYAELDRRRPVGPVPTAAAVDAVVEAVSRADPVALADALCNDLQEPALSLRPELASLLATGRRAGALGALISGSGPTCVFLHRSVEHAAEAARLLPGSFVAEGPADGATVL